MAAWLLRGGQQRCLWPLRFWSSLGLQALAPCTTPDAVDAPRKVLPLNHSLSPARFLPPLPPNSDSLPKKKEGLLIERLESEVGACGALARDAAGPRPAPIRQSHGRDYAGLRTGSWIPCPAGTGAQEYWRGLGSALCFKRVCDMRG